MEAKTTVVLYFLSNEVGTVWYQNTYRVQCSIGEINSIVYVHCICMSYMLKSLWEFGQTHKGGQKVTHIFILRDFGKHVVSEILLRLFCVFFLLCDCDIT